MNASHQSGSTAVSYRVWLIDPDPRSAPGSLHDSYDARFFLAGVWVILKTPQGILSALAILAGGLDA